MTREQWLAKLTTQLQPLFERAGYTIPPNVRSSCSFPSKSATSRKNRRIGECWTDSASDDGTFEVFVSPTIADPMRVAGILAHELVHAAVGLACGHKGEFRRCAVGIGLTGPMTATSEGEVFTAFVAPLLAKLGAYPHAVLHASNSAKNRARGWLRSSAAAAATRHARRASGWTTPARPCAPATASRWTTHNVTGRGNCCPV